MKIGSSHFFVMLALFVLNSRTSAFAGYGDNVELNVRNGDARPATFKVVPGPGSFFDEVPPAFTLQPGETKHLSFVHDPGSAFDDKPGNFRLEVGNGQSIYFWHNESGPLGITMSSMSAPIKRFERIGDGQEGGGEYLVETSPFVPAPPDASMFTPRNPIANDVGVWSESSSMEEFLFVANEGMFGNFYDDALGVELFHVQHIVRLPNKNGRAYFMVAQSRAHNGWISLLETDPGVLDPTTDLVTSQGPNVPVGRYIWQDLFTGSFNGLHSPVGNWNHPCKMDVMGGVLIVCAQNWEDSAPVFYGKGDSIDKLLFYDVRDPQHPRYWGAITSDELGVPEISTSGLVRTPNGDYLLCAGGDGTYTQWVSRTISPDIRNWQRTSDGAFSGQHGMNFSSFQNSTDGSWPRGAERMFYYDSVDANRLGFTEYGYDAANRNLVAGRNYSYPYDLPGAKRDWDASSLYVSPNGTTVIYSMCSGDFGGTNGKMFQLSNPSESAKTIVSGIVGTSWNYNYAGNAYSFSFGEGTIEDFKFWEGVTWQQVSPSQIQLTYPDNRTMVLNFDSNVSFRGTDFDGQTAISGSRN